MSLAVDKRGRLKLSERAIEKQIVDAMTAHGWLILRTNVFAGAVIQRQGSVEPGIPDLMARRQLHNTRWWQIRWIEVKRPGGRLSAAQEKWRRDHPDESVRIATCLEDIEDLL